jgi:hypothetical protein
MESMVEDEVAGILKRVPWSKAQEIEVIEWKMSTGGNQNKVNKINGHRVEICPFPGLSFWGFPQLQITRFWCHLGWQMTKSRIRGMIPAKSEVREQIMSLSPWSVLG